MKRFLREKMQWAKEQIKVREEWQHTLKEWEASGCKKPYPQTNKWWLYPKVIEVSIWTWISHTSIWLVLFYIGYLIFPLLGFAIATFIIYIDIKQLLKGWYYDDGH